MSTPPHPNPLVPGAPDPTFADLPKLALDDLLRQLIERAEDVMATQGRLRGLLRANQIVVGNLALPVLLRRTVQAACELARARYGALGVIDTEGGLEQFVHVGVTDDVVTRIGHLPQGRGLLGALIEDPRPIRLDRMSDDPRSVGFPAGHPPMDSFLGVPVRVRDVVFGNLYLSGSANGRFSEEDEELVAALAATLGVAIENARLYEQARRRQEWLQASTEVTRQLLSAEGEEPLLLIARHAQRLADADVVTVVLPTADGRGLIVEVAAGAGAEELMALTSPTEGTLVGQALDSGAPVLVADLNALPPQTHPFASLVDDLPLGPVMVLPLGGPSTVRGALVVARVKGGRPFTEADLGMAATFADHAALALELADARADQQRIVLLEDHERIARDLHDHVTQRLFAIGLTVQSVASVLDQGPLADRLTRVVSDVDETIRQTRTSIFQLRGPLGPEMGTARVRLLDVVAEVTPIIGFAPQVRFSGPIDSLVPEAVAEDMVAVLREALTNVARHARATRIDVHAAADASAVTMEVLDDGVGLSGAVRRSGLANLRTRAELHGGTLMLGGAPEPNAAHREGTHLRWTVPLQ